MSALRIAMMCALLGLAPGVRAETWTLGKTVELPGAGMRFRPPAEMAAIPVVIPDRVPLRRRDGAPAATVVEADAWWRYRQTEARFSHDDGELMVAAVRTLPPNPAALIQQRFAAPDDLDKRPPPERWDNDALGAWLEAYTGLAAPTNQSVHRKWSMSIPCRRYPVANGGDVRHERFLLRIGRGSEAQFALLWFSFARAGAAPNASAIMAQCVRSVVEGTVREGDKGANIAFQHWQPPAGEAAGGSTRGRVLAGIRSLDDWWHVDLPHYLLVSDLPRNNRTLVIELQKHLESLRKAFTKMWPPRAAAANVSIVRVFNNRDDYVRYVGPDYQWTMGIWIPGKEELVISASDKSGSSVKRGRERDEILSFAYHEALHQYAHHALGGMPLPLWFNEGHACLFETVRFDRTGAKVEIRENEARAEHLLAARPLGPRFDIVGMMFMSAEEFYAMGAAGPDVDRVRMLHYCAASSLVYFLRKGAPAVFPGVGYEAICDRILNEVTARPHDHAGAVEAALEGVDRDQLADDFYRFWSSKSMRSKGEAWPFP